MEAIFVGITIAAFGAYFAYRAVQKKRYTDAADKFRSIVTGTLKDLYSISGDIKWPDSNFDITVVLASYYPTLSAAVTDYADITKNRKAFLEDWDIYRGKYGIWKGKDQDYMQYTGADFDGLPIEPREKIFHKNVTNLLKHSKT